MAEGERTSAAMPIKVLLVLLSIFIFYVFAISHWYWDCDAQIDASSLTAKCPSPPGGNGTIAGPPKDNANQKQNLWPDFGAGNDTYGDVSRFWGDDLVSNFFQNIFKVISDVVGPSIKNTVVPQWNKTMEPKFTRLALVGVLAWLLKEIGGAAVKDLYKQLKERLA